MSQVLQSSYDKLKTCKDVEQIVKSPGWINTLEPWLNAAITKCVGGRVEDSKGFPKWDGGSLQKPEDDDLEYYIARKQALMDFYNMVYNHLRAISGYENNIKVLEERQDKEEKHPTMGRSRYARDI